MGSVSLKDAASRGKYGGVKKLRLLKYKDDTIPYHSTSTMIA